MALRFRVFVFAVQYRLERVFGGAFRVVSFAVKWTTVAALVAAGAQGVALGSAAWNDGILEADLRHELGPHQSMRFMEQAIAARVRTETGIEPSRVRVSAICPAPGPAGPLERIAPTCLLSGEVELERQVMWIRKRVLLAPTEKVFREAIPRR